LKAGYSQRSSVKLGTQKNVPLLPALFCRHEKMHFYKNVKILRLILLDISGAEFYEESDPQNRILKSPLF
jgi:hypothetical protein